MKQVLEHPEEAQAKGIRAREDMVKNYSEEAFGVLLENEFHRIAQLIAKQQTMTSQTDEEL